MRDVFKIFFLIFILFQLFGYPSSSEMFDDGTDHMMRRVITRNVGFPSRWMQIRIIEGCTTPPHIERDIFHSAPFINLVYWITVFWIVSKIPVRKNE